MPLDDALGDFEHQRLRVEDGAVEIKDDGLHRHCRHEPGFIMQSRGGGGYRISMSVPQLRVQHIGVFHRCQVQV